MAGPTDTIRVLHVDDEPSLADMVATFLERDDDRITVQTATNVEDGQTKLANHDIDCIISDYDMPGQNGVEFLEAVREERPDLPFILYTGRGSEEVASEAISIGVTDYLQKESGTDQYTILANRVVNAVERYRAEREAEKTRTQLRAISENTTDAIIIIDANSRIQFANPAVEDQFGYTPSELQGQRLTTLMPQRYREQHLAALDQYLETGERLMDWTNIEFSGLHKDGYEVPLSVSYGEFQQDGEHRFIGILRDISERTQMEAELREREERFRQLAENIEEVVWMTDPKKEELLYVNPAYEDIWGQSTETLYENPTAFLDAVHPENRDRVEAALNKQSSGEYDEEFRIIRPDGELRWVRDRAVPIENDEGEVYRMVGIASDITERKEQTRQLETLINNLPGMVYQCRNTSNWPMELVRGECEDLTGYSAAELECDDGIWGEEIIHPADQDRAWSIVQEAIDNDRPFELTYRIQTKDGATKWMWERGRVVDPEYTQETLLEGFITDITEQKEREQKRETTIEFLQSLYDVAIDRTLDVNEKITRLLELGPEQLDLPSGYLTRIEMDEETREGGIQRVIEASGDHELLQPGDSCPLSQSYCRKTIETDEVVTIQDALAAGWNGDPAYELFDLGCYIGTKITVNGDLHGTVFFAAESPREEPFTDADEAFVRLMSQLVSYELEREDAQQELKQQNARLEEFASVVSHDLRNPLNIAEGRLALGREECDNEHLETVARAHERMNILIDDLLTLAREGDEAMDPELVQLAEYCETCWETVETADATLVIDSNRTLTADRSKLQQLLENLFRNAVEHGGEDVTVTVGKLDTGFYIEDDGPGIPENERDNVFDAGYSTKDEGTGFGLNIIKRVVEAHGWGIDVTESSAGGARFEITGVQLAAE